MCRSVDVVDLQEKVQEIGLAVAITLFLVNCDKKNCWSVLRQVKAYQRHFATMQFSAAKGKLPVKSCSQLVEHKEAYLLDTLLHLLVQLCIGQGQQPSQDTPSICRKG